MNKLFLYLLGAVVIGGVAWYGMQSSGQPSSQTNTANQEDGSSGSLCGLMAMSTSQECTFNAPDSNGVAYIANNQMRGDFNISDSEVNVVSHTIVKDNKMYVWTDGQAQGFVMEIPEAEAEANTSAQTQVDLDEEIDYDCKSWRVDNSKFQTPTGVQFSDMSAYLQSIQNLQGSGSAAVDLSQFGL